MSLNDAKNIDDVKLKTDDIVMYSDRGYYIVDKVNAKGLAYEVRRVSDLRVFKVPSKEAYYGGKLMTKLECLIYNIDYDKKTS